MKRIALILIVFISMTTFSKAQMKYSDTVKNVLGVNIFPILSLINNESMGETYLYFSYKHIFPKGAIRIGGFLESKDDGRFNDEYVITQNDSLHTFHTITGYSSNGGLRFGYEWRKQIRPKLYLSFGADMLGAYNKIEMYDQQYTVKKMADTIWLKYDYMKNFMQLTHTFMRIGFSPFIAYDYIISKKFSLTAELNYDWISEFSLDAGNISSGGSGSPSFNLMLNYLFVKRK